MLNDETMLGEAGVVRVNTVGKSELMTQRERGAGRPLGTWWGIWCMRVLNMCWLLPMQFLPCVGELVVHDITLESTCPSRSTVLRRALRGLFGINDSLSQLTQPYTHRTPTLLSSSSAHSPTSPSSRK